MGRPRIQTLLKGNATFERVFKNFYKIPRSAAFPEISSSPHSFGSESTPVSPFTWHLHSSRLRRSRFERCRLSALHNRPAPKIMAAHSTRLTVLRLRSTVPTIPLLHRMRLSPFVLHHPLALRFLLARRTIIVLTRPTGSLSKSAVQRTTMAEICIWHR